MLLFLCLHSFRFADLLNSIASKYPEVRIRFTSPHPKDFPYEVLRVIASHHNICKSIHVPMQSGSTSVLSRMRRGYSREAYISLIEAIRDLIPHASLSTDIIVGFCDETDSEHADTVSLMQQMKFDQAFMYAYSLRDKTHAGNNI